MSVTTEQLVAALRPITSRVRRDVTAIKVPEGGSRWGKEPLNKARLAKHIEGGLPRGCCPIKAGESTTRLGLFDLDSHKGATPWPEMVDVARRIIDIAMVEGISLIPFRSSGGKGIHLFALWDAPQDAYSVRQALAGVLAACGLKSGTKGVAEGEVEVFPKQNSVPAAGYGNQFILPLAGMSTPLSYDLAVLDRDAIIDMGWPSSSPVTVFTPPAPPTYTCQPTTEFAALQAQLAAISNSGDDELDYDPWRNVVFAIHHETQGSAVGLALAHEFSSRSAKYDPELIDERIWPYITSDRDSAITGRSILFMAREHGYLEDVTDDFDVLPAEDVSPTHTHEHLARFTPLQAATFSVSGSTKWLIKGILPAADLAVLYGASGSGKSFIALDMAMAIARGVPWRGHRAPKGRVAYVCAEGAGGFRRRLQAYAHQYAIPLDQIDLFVIPAAPDLLKGDDVRALIKALKEAGQWALVIMDTFAQVMPGGNENSGEDVGKALGHCKTINAVLGCPILLIHHSGKDETRGARGWSGLRAACDTEMEVIRANHERVLSVTKQKDGEEGQEHGFKLLTVVLGEDEDGEDITSCVVEHTDGTTKSVKKAARKLGPVEELINQSLLEGLDLATGAMEREELLAATIEKLDVSEGKRDRRRQRAVRALEDLVGAGRIKVAGSRCSPANT